MNGEFLKKARKDKGMSQKELAQKSNLSVSYIQQLERGEKNNPSIEAVSSIAAALDVELSKLIDIDNLIDLSSLEKLKSAISAKNTKSVEDNNRLSCLTMFVDVFIQKDNSFAALIVAYLNGILLDDKTTDDVKNAVLSNIAEYMEHLMSKYKVGE